MARRAFAVAASGLMVASLLMPATARAAGTPPAASKSHYMFTSYLDDLGTLSRGWAQPQTQIYNLGKKDAIQLTKASGRCQQERFVSILSFGGITRQGWPGSYAGYGARVKVPNTVPQEFRFHGMDTIGKAAEQYARGFASISGPAGCSLLKVVIGFTNSSVCGGSTLPCQVGGTNQFAEMLAYTVIDTVRFVNLSGLARNVWIWGGADLEPHWGSAADARALVDWYGGLIMNPGVAGDAYYAWFWNFGSAESGFWSDNDIAYVGWQHPLAYTMGQIYFPNTATVQWRRVRDSTNNFVLSGALTDCPHRGHPRAATSWRWGSDAMGYDLSHSSIINSSGSEVPDSCR